jgi:hypothetical protein
MITAAVWIVQLRMLAEALIPHYFHIVIWGLLLLFCYAALRSGIALMLWKAVRQNIMFFAFLVVMATVVMAWVIPFVPFPDADEFLYLNVAQNIAREHRSAWCAESQAGRCTVFVLYPSPMGAPPLYALLYSDDYRVFYARVVALNTSLFLLASILVFLTAEVLFRDRIVAMASSFLALMIPNSIVYSRTALSDPVASFFFLWACLAFALLFAEKKRRHNEWTIMVLLIALTLMASMRVEYSVLLAASIAAVAVSLFTRRGSWFQMWRGCSIGNKVIGALTLLGVMGTLSFTLWVYVPKHVFPGQFSIANLNWNHVALFSSSAAAVVLTGCFVWGVVHAIRHWNPRKASGTSFVILAYSCVFLFFLVVYSFYLYPRTRFLLSITPIYLIIAAATIVAMARMIPLARVSAAMAGLATLLLALGLSLPHALRLSWSYCMMCLLICR